MTQLLSASGIRKDYGPTRALSSVDINVDRGKVVALLGANGSGKSTLTRILTGAASANAGTIEFDSHSFAPKSPLAAQKAGVVAVAQELSLVPSMTVAQNIWLGAQHLLPHGKGITRRQKEASLPLLELFAGVQRDSVTPDTMVADLTPDERQLVEILKAVARKPKLLVLDEATSTLDRSQAARLFDLMRAWCGSGMAIIFVSHRMDEVFTISDEVCVVRGGETVLASSIADVTHQSVVQAMTGHILLTGRSEIRTEAPPQEVILSLQGLSAKGVKATDVTLRRGEILGLGGLQGQGQSALLRAVAGDSRALAGSLILDGKELSFRSPADAMKCGVHYVGGDRKELALFQRPILENLLASSWTKSGWYLNSRALARTAGLLADKFGVKRAGLDFPLSSLSGGNAQKVLLARAWVQHPTVLVLDDPTKGVDVMTKQQIYATLRELQLEGTSILLYSSDDEELLDMAHRVVVFHDGGIVAELRDRDLSKTSLVAASMGITQAEEATAHDR